MYSASENAPISGCLNVVHVFWQDGRPSRQQRRSAPAAATQPPPPDRRSRSEPEHQGGIRQPPRGRPGREGSSTADEGPGPSMREDSHAERSQEASPARSTRRRAAFLTPVSAGQGRRVPPHSNGGADEVGGGRRPRRQGSRSADKRDVQDEDSEEEGEEKGVGGWVGGRRRKGRQRSLEELHRADSQQQQQQDDAMESHPRTGLGLRFKFTRNGVSL